MCTCFYETVHKELSSLMLNIKFLFNKLCNTYISHLLIFLFNPDHYHMHHLEYFWLLHCHEIHIKFRKIYNLRATKSNFKRGNSRLWLIMFIAVRDQWLLTNTFSTENWIPLKPVLGTLHFSLPLTNRLTKTESSIVISIFWFGCSRGIDF